MSLIKATENDNLFRKIIASKLKELHLKGKMSQKELDKLVKSKRISILESLAVTSDDLFNSLIKYSK